MSVAFKQWCDDNYLTILLLKFLETDGKTIKQQYVSGDQGMERNRHAAMALRKWHTDDNDLTVFNNKQVKLGGDSGWQPFHNHEFPDTGTICLPTLPNLRKARGCDNSQYDNFVEPTLAQCTMTLRCTHNGATGAC
eukprot:537174-Amphidinium_carterae.1